MSTPTLEQFLRHLRLAAEADALRGEADTALLRRYSQDRDEAAFAELVLRHGPRVLAACRRVLGRSHDAEDAFQVAFAALASRASSVAESVLGWVYRVAVNAAVRIRNEAQ